VQRHGQNFGQKSRIVGVDEQQVIGQAEVEFVLKKVGSHATNVHYFGGIQFQQYGLHHVEIYLEMNCGALFLTGDSGHAPRVVNSAR